MTDVKHVSRGVEGHSSIMLYSTVNVTDLVKTLEAKGLDIGIHFAECMKDACQVVPGLYGLGIWFKSTMSYLIAICCVVHKHLDDKLMFIYAGWSVEGGRVHRPYTYPLNMSGPAYDRFMKRSIVSSVLERKAAGKWCTYMSSAALSRATGRISKTIEQNRKCTCGGDLPGGYIMYIAFKIDHAHIEYSRVGWCCMGTALATVYGNDMTS